MDIRDALNDTYLARFFDPGTMDRARGYLDRVIGVHVAHETASSLTVTALVWGGAATPYDVQLHVEVNEVADWIFSSCTCPVGRLCKHGAALAMTLQSSPMDLVESTQPPPWRRRIDEVTRAVAHRTAATISGKHLALEVSRRRATRWSRGTPGDFALRPLRPAKRGGWVRSGADWIDIGQPTRRAAYHPDHAEAVLSLHRALVGNHAFLVSGAAPMLDDFGPRLIPLLRAAVEAGVELVAGEGVESITLGPLTVRVSAELTADDTTVSMHTCASDGASHWTQGQVVPVGHPAHTLVLVDEGAVTLAELAEPIDNAITSLLVSEPVTAPLSDQDEFLDALTPISRLLPMSSPDESVKVPPPPAPVLALTVTWRSSTAADLEWRWHYGIHSCDPTSSDTLQGRRDLDAEQAIVSSVPDSLWSTDTVTGGEALALALHDLPHLRELPDLTVTEVERPDFRESTAVPEVEFVLAEDQPQHTDWLDLEVQVSVDGETVPLPEVLAAVTLGEEFLVLPSGAFISLDRPEFARLHEVVAAASQLRERSGERVSVGTHDLSVWAELDALGVVDSQAAQWVQRAAALRDLAQLPQPEPEGLMTTLRPYQRDGFAWLAFLHDHGLGGILADDMGLGKTLQVLALIQYAKARGAASPFLVVAPTSVVTAWRQQAAAHAPGLRLGVISRRTDDVVAIAAHSDVVVTTYALLRLANEKFAGPHWAGLILDEAQQVKNHQSKTYGAARSIDADFRLAVTGTPFENRLMELWALLSITAPGLYPTPRRFREVVVGPVEKAGDELALARFRKRIRPFLLRRTKELVAADLPPKQEQVQEVDLEPRHRKIYDTHFTRERQKVLGLIEDDFERNRVAIFSSLTKLRQLALDPALVDDAHDAVGSAKVNLLAEQLGEITAEGHRALVFSQFTSFLGRVRDRLAQEGIPTVYLDGATRDREGVIETFRSGAAQVFLISLKAGGVGLTLTEADYVYVLDPWWNPAAEAQAVDRAHRIGQDKHVHVYRLVATDTIEEKVMALKQRKAELFAKVIDGGVASSTGITAEDIRGLFED